MIVFLAEIHLMTLNRRQERSIYELKNNFNYQQSEMTLNHLQGICLHLASRLECRSMQNFTRIYLVRDLVDMF